MHRTYKISICVPIYGVEKYIERCAISLFEQTYKNIEYIFINDCTKDNSIKVLEETIKKYPDRQQQVKIINHPINKGLAVSRNTGVANSTGEFIMHVDSDDYIDKDTVQKAVQKQSEDNADIISFGCYREYRNNTIIQLPPEFNSPEDMCLKLIEKKINIGIWGRLYRLSLYTDNNIRVKENINVAEDYQVSPILAYYAQKVSYIQEPLYHYNLCNPSSYVNSYSEKRISDVFASFNVLKDFFQEKDDKFRNAIKYSEVNILYRIIILCIKNRDKYNYKKYHSLLHKIQPQYKKKLDIKGKLIVYINSYMFTKLIHHLYRMLKR